MTNDIPRQFDPGNKVQSAAQFREDRMPTLVRSQGEWLEWDGSSYQPREAATIEQSVSAWLNEQTYQATSAQGTLTVSFKPRRVDIGEVVGALVNLCHLPKNIINAPAWLPGASKALAVLDPTKMISCRNGLLHWPTRTLYPQTAQFFTRNAVPFDYDPTATAPERWLSFLDEVTAASDGTPRPELVRLIREMIGYLISGDLSQQRVFFMSGLPRSGKGTIMRTADRSAE